MTDKESYIDGYVACAAQWHVKGQERDPWISRGEQAYDDYRAKSPIIRAADLQNVKVGCDLIMDELFEDIEKSGALCAKREEYRQTFERIHGNNIHLYFKIYLEKL